jgi:ubiquinone/menaquinone biosynthesis C-methylase UbiE
MVHANYVDLSGRMLEAARQKSGVDRVVYRQADARNVEFAPEEYDLIATHFFFDCFNQHDLETLISRIASAAVPGARWVVSEFRTHSILARLLVRALYLFFRVTTGLRNQSLADHRIILCAQGFRLVDASQSRGGLVVSELWER